MHRLRHPRRQCLRPLKPQVKPWGQGSGAPHGPDRRGLIVRASPRQQVLVSCRLSPRLQGAHLARVAAHWPRLPFPRLRRWPRALRPLFSLIRGLLKRFRRHPQFRRCGSEVRVAAGEHLSAS